MVVERSALYGSRNISDQHRDMRLDVDNMSYEVTDRIPLYVLFFSFSFLWVFEHHG